MKNLTGKNLFITVLIGVVVLLLILRSCSCGRQQPGKITVIDTVYSEHKSDTVYQPQLDTVIRSFSKQVPVAIYFFDTMYVDQFKNVDTAAILKDFFAKAVYIDTEMVKYGSIIITDTVTRNRIASRHLQTSFLIPTIEKTTTIIQPKRNQVYVGLGGEYNMGSRLAAVGGGLMFKNKKDRAIAANVFVDAKGNLIYSGNIFFKLSFKK